MRTAITFAFMLGAWGLLPALAVADDPLVGKVSYLRLDPGEGSAAGSGGTASDVAVGYDEQLDLRKSDFVRFAQAKLEEMNRNHRLSRPRMQIDKNPDGTYRAVFHQIDDASMACEVSHSQSKTIPYVAVLSYREEVFATSCGTLEECRSGAFSTVGYIPNRHIFSYSNGGWK